MKIRYRVLSVTSELIPVTATVGDRQISASAPGVTIDAQSEDGSMCHTFRFLDEDAPDSLAAGQFIVATFEIEEPE